ncbi:MAG: FkbM family methyltransferase [Pirellula sp.]
MIRRLVEVLSRNVVLRRRLPSEFGGGTIFVSPGARLLYWKPNIHLQEKFLFDMAKLLIVPGDVVWDIGANAGVFSVAAASVARQNGRVLAFEADTWLVSLMLRTTKSLRGEYAPIDVINAAVSEKFGFAEFAIAARGRQANFLVEAGGAKPAGGVRETYRVFTVGRDSLIGIAPAPRVIKMDIEGAELMAMQGAHRMIGEVRPRILCEIDPKNAVAMKELICRAGYQLFDAENSGQTPCPIELPTLNTLFLPNEDPLVQKLQNTKN